VGGPVESNDRPFSRRTNDERKTIQRVDEEKKNTPREAAKK
jgi:hypothetical protein